jgi:hypothetical protein
VYGKVAHNDNEEPIVVKGPKNSKYVIADAIIAFNETVSKFGFKQVVTN